MRRRLTLSKAKRLEDQGRYDEAIDLLTSAAARSADDVLLGPTTGLRRKAFAATAPAPGRATWPPSYEDCFESNGAPPEIAVEELDAEKLGAGLVHHGCLLVRGLLDTAQVGQLSDAVEAAFRAADGHGDARKGWFLPVEADDERLPMRRDWVRQTGGVWAGDSPPALCRLITAFDEIDLGEVLAAYFGERPALSLEKVTLRLTTPDARGAWHQDAAFMGSSLRSVNVWIALTACGGDASAPGLDVMPRRLDDLVETGTRGSPLPDFVGPELIAEMAEDCPVVRPRFEPGDALIFDDRFLHSTGVTPGMTENRLAIECWFFTPSTVPEQYVPMAF